MAEGKAAGFEAATGAVYLPVGSTTRRNAEVREAFTGLLQIREVMNTHVVDRRSVPSLWERRLVVRCVAITLEYEEIPPSALNLDGQRTATGYCVTKGERRGTARVAWLGPRGSGAAFQETKELHRCAIALERHGWVALQYKGPRSHWYLDVEPPA